MREYVVGTFYQYISGDEEFLHEVWSRGKPLNLMFGSHVLIAIKCCGNLHIALSSMPILGAALTTLLTDTDMLGHAD